MGIILRQSFANTMFSYMGAVIGFINMIWLFPFVLEAEQFGLTRVLFSMAVIGAQIASLGMGSVTLRFFPQFRNPDEKHFGYLFIALALPLAGFFVLIIAGLVFQDSIINYYSEDRALFADYYALVFPLLFFILYFHLLESYIRSLYDTVAATFLQDVLLRLFQTAAIVIYFTGWIPFGFFMILYAGTFGLQTLLLLCYIGYRRHLFLKPDFRKMTRFRAKSMADYAFFAILGSIAALAIGNIDMMMIGGMLSLSDTAIYAVSFYLASMIKIPSKGLQTISKPLIAQAHHQNDLGTISQIYSKSAINQLLVGGLLFIGIWINLEHVYRFLPEEYHAGMFVFLFIGLSNAGKMAFGLNATIIRTSSWYRFDLYVTLFLILLVIITNLLFIPVFGVTGAALGTALSYLLYKLAYLAYIRWRMKILPFTRKTIGAIGLLVFTFFISRMVPELPIWPLDLIVRSAVATGILLSGIFMFHLSDDLKTAIEHAFRWMRSLWKK